MGSNESAREIPEMFCGAAWKEDATEDLVCTAIDVGFRGFDNANQRRHYNEAAVGRAISEMSRNGTRREEFFIQTKYTFESSQDHRMPYDPSADYSAHVRQSFQSSLENLQVDYIDSTSCMGHRFVLD